MIRTCSSSWSTSATSCSFCFFINVYSLYCFVIVKSCCCASCNSFSITFCVFWSPSWVCSSVWTSFFLSVVFLVISPRSCWILYCFSSLFKWDKTFSKACSRGIISESNSSTFSFSSVYLVLYICNSDSISCFNLSLTEGSTVCKQVGQEPLTPCRFFNFLLSSWPL